jgi:hypothetical protein
MKVLALNEVELGWFMSKVEEAIAVNEEELTKMDNALEDGTKDDWDFPSGGSEWNEYEDITYGRVLASKYIKWLLEEGISEEGGPRHQQEIEDRVRRGMRR